MTRLITQLDGAVAFPLRAKKIVSDLAVTRRFTSRDSSYIVDHVHWTLHGYADFWASWYVGQRFQENGKPIWVRLGRHHERCTAIRACMRDARQRRASANN